MAKSQEAMKIRIQKRETIASKIEEKLQQLEVPSA